MNMELEGAFQEDRGLSETNDVSHNAEVLRTMRSAHSRIRLRERIESCGFDDSDTRDSLQIEN